MIKLRDLHIVVNNKVATYLTRDGEIVCGNSDYNIVFSFDSEWNAYKTKTARFEWNGKAVTVEFTGNTVKVPILSNTTRLKVGVYVEEMSTTTSAEIPCLISCRCAEGNVSALVLSAMTATDNGLYRASTYGSDGFSEFKVEVPEYVPALMAKAIVANGEYLASEDGVDGYSKITVDVPVPENYKSDEEITELLIEIDDLLGVSK